MANFYWVGPNNFQPTSAITGISAFDFNEPTNWLEFYETGVVDGTCRPYIREGFGGKQVAVSASRGIGMGNYDADSPYNGGWGNSFDENGNIISNICRTYYRATRAPRGGDIVVVGDDVCVSATPLLFGGFQGGETGGVWKNGGDCASWDADNQICTEPTDATGTTYDTALAAFYYGGLFAGHPDMNYPWPRLGGGFTANSEKYSEYQLPDYRNLGQQLWNWWFNGGTFIDQRSGQVYERATGFYPNATWPADIYTTEPRTQSLRIKTNVAQEAIRSYAQLPMIFDVYFVKNLEKRTDPVTGIIFDAVRTRYERCSRNMTSWVSGWFEQIFNKVADAQKDWYGVTLDDAVHDWYYGNRNERLILDGVTAGAVKCYISDQLTIKDNSLIGSVWIDDRFVETEPGRWSRIYERDHSIAGTIDKNAAILALGLTGTSIAETLDSTLSIDVDISSFVDSRNMLSGAFTINFGNNSGLTGITCSVDRIDLRVAGSHEWGRPGTLQFIGNAPIVINIMNMENAIVKPSAINPETYVSIGEFNMGNKGWFYPGANPLFKNWYFGKRISGSTTFLGGMQFSQEYVNDDNQTSALMPIPGMKLHNAAVGVTAPARLFGGIGRGSVTSLYTSISQRSPNDG